MIHRSYLTFPKSLRHFLFCDMQCLHTAKKMVAPSLQEAACRYLPLIVFAHETALVSNLPPPTPSSILPVIYLPSPIIPCFHPFMTPTRLTKRSKPVRLLCAKFEDGKITGKEDPKVVWQSNDVFSGCNLNM